MIEINGKEYSLWSQFVEGKEKFIGGILQEFPDSIFEFKILDPEDQLQETIITDIELVPNGEKSAFFRICGEKFSCGFDVGVGGITAGEEGWITFSGYMGHTFRIK